MCTYMYIGNGAGRYGAESAAGQRSAGTARKALHGGVGGCAKGCVRIYVIRVWAALSREDDGI